MKASTFFQMMFLVIAIVIMQGGAFYVFSLMYDTEIENVTTSIDALTVKIDSMESKIGAFENKIAEPSKYVKVTKGSSAPTRVGSDSIEDKIDRNLQKYLGRQ